MIEINRQEAFEIAVDALAEHGISGSAAEQTSEVLLSADARGKHSHGLLRLPRIIRGITQGNVDPEGTIEVVSQQGGTVAIDGGARLGPVVASVATDKAIARAEKCGIGAVGVHNSNHLGILGYYTEQILQNGFIGIGMTNTEPAMPPHGGDDPILGTNPIAVGLPTDPVFNLDMSTASIARGTVLQYRETDRDLPSGVALDANGRPTTDPSAALDGTVLPFGGYRGSGLAIAIEVLAGGLVGAEMGTDVTGTFHTEDPCTKGDLFLAIDPGAFGVGDFDSRVSAFFDEVTTDESTPGNDGVRLPGQRSGQRDRSASTVQVEADLWNELRALAGAD